MKDWDELCILCGISPNPPRKIYPSPEFGAQDLADKLIKHDPSILADLLFEKDALVERLRDALTLDSPRYGRPWNWEGFTTCVAVGHFHKKNGIPPQIVNTESGEGRRIPDGVKVKTHVVEMSSCGDFNFIIYRNRDGRKSKLHKSLSCSSSTPFSGDSFGDFFLSEACFHYLQAWIDQSQFVPSTRAGSLSFAGELYEVVNSRKRGRVNGVGTLQWMDYGGIENTLVRTQSYLHRGLKVPKFTAAAIRSKSTRQRIFDAILRDCGSWKFDAPNSWPSPLSGYDASHRNFSVTSNQLHLMEMLPNEIFFHIFSYIDSIQTYLTLAATTKTVYNILTNDSFLNSAIKEMSLSPSGCLFWLRPVSPMFDKTYEAHKALSSFLPDDPKYEYQSWTNACYALFGRSDFPWISFVRACYASDSMMNRKRIWGQVKQLEEVWKEYRLSGWEVDRFGVPVEWLL